MGLSFLDRLDKGQKLYVRNMTRNPSAVVSMTFRARGSAITVKIPPSTYPFELCPSMISPDMVREGGQQLGTFISTGALKIIPPKMAREVLAEPGAKEEADALLSRTNSDAVAAKWARSQKKLSEGSGHPANPAKDDDYVDGPGSVVRTELLPPKDPMKALKEKLGMEDNVPSRARHQLEMAGAPDEVSPRVLGIMANWSSVTESAVLKQLKAMRSRLQTADLRYVMDKARSGTMTYKWARKHMSEIE